MDFWISADLLSRMVLMQNCNSCVTSHLVSHTCLGEATSSRRAVEELCAKKKNGECKAKESKKIKKKRKRMKPEKQGKK